MIFISLYSCHQQEDGKHLFKELPIDSFAHPILFPDTFNVKHQVLLIPQNIRMKSYFNFLDSIINQYPQLLNSNQGEHVLILFNPWVLDTLRGFDYYIQKSKGKIQYDQTKEIVFDKGSRLIIPTQPEVDSISTILSLIRIDVNIPEYRLRIIQHGDTLHTFPIRVGRNEETYLESIGRVVNQRTPIGQGKIISAIRQPVYKDLQTGQKYEETRRDDGRYTLMPIIPSLEPEIGSIKHGTMFHATTNLQTLGRAYSNGCIGLREADMWTLYYFSPPGTPVTIRYDLKIPGQKTIRWKDIYQLEKQTLEQ